MTAGRTKPRKKSARRPRVSTPKSLGELPWGMKEALCAHEVLRRCGFSADVIFVVYHKSRILVKLDTQDREFIIDYVLPRLSRRQFKRMWTAALNLWNTSADEAELEALWHGSQTKPQAASLLTAIHRRGFQFPNVEDPPDPWLGQSLTRFTTPTAEA